MTHLNSSSLTQKQTSKFSRSHTIAHFIIRVLNIIFFNKAWLLRFGTREINIRKDFRKRFYNPHPLIECYAGVNPGHLEILLLRNWLIVFCGKKYSLCR